MSGWVSIEDRLPESGVSVIATYKNEHEKRRTVIARRYGKFEVAHDPCSDELESEYCEEKDEYYWPEGWYEQVENWCDYSDLTIDCSVTHWMPLPEPPK